MKNETLQVWPKLFYIFNPEIHSLYNNTKFGDDGFLKLNYPTSFINLVVAHRHLNGTLADKLYGGNAKFLFE